MNRTALILTIVSYTVLVAFLDFATSAEFVGSILFTFPLALCALQDSKRLLWAITGAVIVLTAAAEFWGFNRVAIINPSIGMANSGILMTSLLTLAVIVHFWIENRQRLALNAIERETAECKFRSLNERLEFAIAVAKVGEWGWDLERNTLVWDATMFEIYGFARVVPMAYEKWAAAVHPEDLPEVESSLQAMIREKNHGSDKFRIIRPDGSVRKVEAVRKVVLNDRGNVTRVIGVNLDITERKHAEAKLLESEERFRILVEGVQDYAIFTLDPDGKIVSWNAGAELIKGYRADEIIGQNFSRFYLQTDINQGKPEQELKVAAESGRSEVEHWRVRKDGKQFWANVVITAARNSAGKLLGFSEISRDISERKKTEARYRGLLEAAPDAMVVVNQGGKIVLLNVQAEKQFGYRLDELVGQKVTNIIPSGFAERLIADGTRTAAEALSQQIGMGIELIGRRKDGSDFPIEIMLSLLESADGILVTAAVRDISVRKAAKEHLTQLAADLSNKHRLLDSIVEGTNDLVYIRDLESRFTFANSACGRLFGRSAAQMIGSSMRDLLPKEYRII